ncbi:MAG TPA: DUF222 domain-containing protein [Intrasporangiaceae bacterium]|nr:DUF222 domain-containing protein [Intrasporangiaceae bacterium]
MSIAASPVRGPLGVVRDGVAGVGVGVAGLLALEGDSFLDRLLAAAKGPASVQQGDIRAVEVAIRRLESVKLALIAKADKEQVALDSGAASTASWVATETKTAPGAAAGQVGLATALDGELPLVQRALEAGEVSTANAGVIASVMGRLPESLSEPEREKVQASLVRDATRLDPSRLRKAGLQALAAAEKSAREVAEHQEQTLADQERRAYQQAQITMHDRGDGTTTGRFTVPTGAAHALRKMLQAMTAPRRDHQKRAGSGAPGASGMRTDEDWTELPWEQKRGRAFVDLLEHLPTDRLTTKVASTVIVTMTLEQALGAAKAAELETLTGIEAGPDVGATSTDTGHVLSTGAARRLACEAGILPLVLGGRSVPLDLGRQERFFSEPQRVALAAQYDECAAEGCDRPFAWSELHHEDPWSRQGRTDLDKAVPLCGFHHHRVHDTGYAHSIHVDDHGRKVVRLRRL